MATVTEAVDIETLFRARGRRRHPLKRAGFPRSVGEKKGNTAL